MRRPGKVDGIHEPIRSVVNSLNPPVVVAYAPAGVRFTAIGALAVHTAGATN
jgi:hypothetical protein